VEEKDWPRTRRLNFSGWLAAATDAVARTRNGTWVGHVRVASKNTSDGGGSIVLGAHRRDPNSSTRSLLLALFRLRRRAGSVRDG
jgi:hypothetical protein